MRVLLFGKGLIMELMFGVVAFFCFLFGFLGIIHPRITLKPKFANTRSRIVVFYSILLLASVAGATTFKSPPSPEELAAEQQSQIDALDAKARSIPASNAIANLAAYEELLALVPDSERYKEKVEHYRPLAEEQRAAQAAAAQERRKEQERIQTEKAKEQAEIRAENARREKKHGSAPENSAWDGSVAAVKTYIKAVAKDPDSVKYEAWGPVKYNEERGWVVTCDWRAKNSFGGYVREVNSFYIRFGRVVDVE